jgi:hypothetical protein
LNSTGIAIVSITVNCTNIAPVAVDDSLTINEDGSGSVDVIVNDSDADTGDVVSLSGIVTQANYGTLTISGDVVTYVASANYCGSDSFSYEAKDVYGPTGSNIGIVNVTVTCENDAPTTSDGSGNVNEDTVLTGQLSGSDIDNSSLSYSIVTTVQNGVLTIIDAVA